MLVKWMVICVSVCGALSAGSRPRFVRLKDSSIEQYVDEAATLACEYPTKENDDQPDSVTVKWFRSPDVRLADVAATLMWLAESSTQEDGGHNGYESVLTGSSTDLASMAQGHAVTFTELRADDDGRYYCHVTLRYGPEKTVLYGRVVVNIKGKPEPELTIYRYNDAGEVVEDIEEGVEMTIDCITHSTTPLEDVTMVIKYNGWAVGGIVDCTRLDEDERLLCRARRTFSRLERNTSWWCEVTWRGNTYRSFTDRIRAVN